MSVRPAGHVGLKPIKASSSGGAKGAAWDYAAKERDALTTLVRNASLAFIAAETNGDQELSFDEFVSVLPKETLEKHPAASLREIFNMADTDGNGSISREEFFFWAMNWAFSSTGSTAHKGIEAVFRTYDVSGDGELNLLEFSKAVDSMGFGSIAPTIFTELDVDQTGTVSASELVKAIQNRSGGYSRETQRLLVAMTFDMGNSGAPEPGGGVVTFDSSPWSVSTADGVRDVLRERMGAVITVHGLPARPWDIWCALLESARLPRMTHTVTREQFKLGVMGAFGFVKEAGGGLGGGGAAGGSRGYKAKKYTSLSMSKLSTNTGGANDVAEDDALGAAFAAIDEMSDRRGEGSVSYEDLHQWLNGSVATRTRAREVTFGTRHRKPGFEAPLGEIEWTEDILREELQTMLLSESPPLSSLDLMLAYDKDPDGQLSRKEWTVMMKRLVADEAVWDASNVKACVLATFDKIAGKDAQLSIEEFQSWLVRGWLERKHVLAQVKADELRDLCRGARSAGASVDEALHALSLDVEAAAAATASAAAALGPTGDQHEPLPAARPAEQTAEGTAADQASAAPTKGAAAAAANIPATPRGASIMALFARIDSDGDGKISEGEAHLIARLLECNPNTFWKLLCKYDEDGSGNLTLNEFEAAIKGRIFAAFFPGSDDQTLAGQIRNVNALLDENGRKEYKIL